MLFSKTSLHDYEKLCSLDCLGIEVMIIVIIFDYKLTENSASLNDCLETGPPLQNLMWDILVRSLFKPILLCGDIEKAFLQIRIQKCKKIALCFHWVKKCDPKSLWEQVC